MSGFAIRFDQPKLSLGQKTKQAAVQGAKFFEYGVNLHSTFVTAVRSADEILKPFSRIARIVSKVLIPFRALSLLTAPFECVNMCKNIKDLTQAPGKLKAYSLMKIAAGAGTLIDNAGSAISLAATIGLPGIELIAAASIPLIAAGAALQLVGVGVTAWSWYKLHTQWNKVKVLLGTQQNAQHKSTMEQYRKAVDYLTHEPTTKKEKFKQSFFGVLQNGHKDKLKQIFNKCSAGELPEKRLEAAFHDVNSYVRHKKIQHALNIAFLITGVAGVALLLLSPLAPMVFLPLGWGVLGISCVGGLMTAGYGLYNNFAFNRSLRKELKPE
jgi:hypothetical protein